MNNLTDIISSDRRDYLQGKLLEEETPKRPLYLFEEWFSDVVAAQILDCNAFTLTTVGKDNIPSARVVLMRDYNINGIVFFTNYKSKKATDIEHNNNVSASFFWAELERQIRIVGVAKKVSDEISDAYFDGRPRLTQLSTWASIQSSTIANRAFLEEEMQKAENTFFNEPVKRPPHWGGYIIEPTYVEFWQGRQSRLHDRIVYQLHEKGCWKKFRLAP